MNFKFFSDMFRPQRKGKSQQETKEVGNAVELVRHSRMFNLAWYLSHYPDVWEADVDAAYHYARHGWKEGRNPGPDFKTKKYLEQYPELIEKNICPLVHFELKNRGKEAKPVVSREPAEKKPVSRKKAQELRQLVRHSGYFDAEWYARTYQVEEDPLEHFMKNFQTNNPSRHFSVARYYAEYKGVAKRGLNPLVHYLRHGRYEGRTAFPTDDLEAILRRKEIFEKKELRKLRVLYVSSTGKPLAPIQDASVRYRCYHPAEVLMQHGAYVNVVSARTFKTVPLSYDYDVYVFHRPGMEQAERINKLKAAHKIVIAEYDDLIFGDANVARQSSIYLSRRKKEAEAIAIYQRNLNALLLFDFVSVSTEALAEEVRKVHPAAKVAVVHNFIPDSILTVAAGVHAVEKDVNQVMYCSGSLSHNRDFDMVAGAFLHSFEQDPNLRLIVVGTLQLPESLSAHPNVFCHEAVDYWQMFRLMSRSCMVIAPLEESLFTRSKSNVKFLEACVSGCYPVASPIPDMERVGDAAITFCRDAAEFEAAFRNRASLCTPQAARENYAYLVKNCGSERFVREFVSMINIFAEA